MDLLQIYQCFCDPTRLRIIHLLMQGPLCVCHFQEILEVPQTKVSQHLAYLRKRGVVETVRKGTWIIYSLPEKPSPELAANLKCLQECVASDKTFRSDLKRLTKVTASISSCPISFFRVGGQADGVSGAMKKSLPAPEEKREGCCGPSGSC